MKLPTAAKAKNPEPTTEDQSVDTMTWINSTVKTHKLEGTPLLNIISHLLKKQRRLACMQEPKKRSDQLWKSTSQ